MKSSRYFSIVSYCTEKQIRKVMKTHIQSIRAMCWILHDKDDVEPHIHILLRTHSTWSAKQINRWFEGFKDTKGEYINTMTEIANDMQGLKLYILHADLDSIKAGKHQYEEKDLVNYGFDDLDSKKNSHDDCYEILSKLMLGVNPRELVKYYGKDFLYHINSYYECSDRITMYEGYRDSRMNLLNDFSNKKDLSVEEVDEWLNNSKF